MSIPPNVRPLLLENIYPVWEDLKGHRDKLEQTYRRDSLYGGSQPVKALIEAVRRATLGARAPSWPSAYLNHRSLASSFDDWLEVALVRPDRLPFSIRCKAVWENNEVGALVKACLFPNVRTYSPPTEELDATFAVIRHWTVGEAAWPDSYAKLGVNALLTSIGLDALAVRPRARPVLNPRPAAPQPAPASKPERPRSRLPT